MDLPSNANLHNTNSVPELGTNCIKIMNGLPKTYKKKTLFSFDENSIRKTWTLSQRKID